MPTYQGQFVPGQVLNAADLNQFHPTTSWVGTNTTSVANATFVKLTMTAGGGGDDLSWLSMANARISPTIKGYYLVTASAISATTSVRSIIAIYRNGALFSKTDLQIGTTGMNIAQLISSVATDYYEIFVYQQSGGTVTYSDFKFSMTLLKQNP